jgi:hypothetical protein
MMTTDSRFPAELPADSAPTAFRVSTAAFVKAVAIVTLIAGTLDIIAAHLHIWAASGNFPTRVFKGIAGGALSGERAMPGGAEIMVLVAFFHYFISFALTLLFFLLFPRVALLRKNVYVVGTVYALFVSMIMNYVVLPLSALPWRAPDFTNKHTYIGIVVLIFVFGLPVVLGTARFYRQQQRA